MKAIKLARQFGFFDTDLFLENINLEDYLEQLAYDEILDGFNRRH